GSRERVEPGRHDPSDRRRERRVVVGLGERRGGLLDEERVPLPGFREQRGTFGALAVLWRAEEMGGKLTRLRLLELVERESRVGGEPASPAGSGVEEVRAGECEQQDRKVAQAGAEQLDQVEQAAVGPMHVLE